MVKVKLFTTRRNYEVDEQINDFLERECVEIVDIKSNTFLDTVNDVIMTSSLLIYNIPDVKNKVKYFVSRDKDAVEDEANEILSRDNIEFVSFKELCKIKDKYCFCLVYREKVSD